MAAIISVKVCPKCNKLHKLGGWIPMPQEVQYLINATELDVIPLTCPDCYRE